MVFDPSKPDIDEEYFDNKDWKDTIYGEFCEEIPSVAPAFYGFGIKMRGFVEYDHSVDSTTRHSRTGFVLYLHNASIYWTSQKQTSIETGYFGSEFIDIQ